MKEQIIIIGAIGSANVIADQIIDNYSNWSGNQEFIGYAFDDPSFGNQVNGYPILGGTKSIYDKYKNYKSVKFLFQMYRPDVISERVQWREALNIPVNRWASFFHRLTMISRTASIGHGTVILSNCTINSNAKVGDFCTIQSGCTIGHDAVLGNNNFIATQTVIGNCNVGNNNFFGLKSNTNNFIDIGSNCFIAMASNVVKSVTDCQKVMGNPAKVFNSKIRRM